MPLISYVDEDDNVIGAGPKREAHEKGIFHRIARVFLFGPDGRMLIHRRAWHLNSMPGRWDQSAGGHVDEGESYLVAAARETAEEIGVTGIILKEELKRFTEERDTQKLKRRFNMVYSATYDGEITANADEVAETQWIALAELDAWMRDRPQDFTPDFLYLYATFRAKI